MSEYDATYARSDWSNHRLSPVVRRSSSPAPASRQGADQRRGPLVDDGHRRLGRRSAGLHAERQHGPIGSHRGARRPGHRHGPRRARSSTECFTPSELPDVVADADTWRHPLGTGATAGDGIISRFPFRRFYRACAPTPRKPARSTREWHVVNADGLVLGRMCTEIARVLRGKHKPIFAPHLDTGDHVVIVNAKKVVLTVGKADRERVYRHSGYPGGIKSETYGELLARKPEDAIRRTVKGMLPEGPARPPDADQAEGLRRPRPPARGPVARAARPVRGQGPLIPEASIAWPPR